jgi:hypothetical protein
MINLDLVMLTNTSMSLMNACLAMCLLVMMSRVIATTNNTERVLPNYPITFWIPSNGNHSIFVPLTANTRIKASAEIPSHNISVFVRVGSIASSYQYDAMLTGPDHLSYYYATLEPYNSSTDVYFYMKNMGSESMVTFQANTFKVIPHDVGVGMNNEDIPTYIEYEYYKITISQGDALYVSINNNLVQHYSHLKITIGDFNGEILYDQQGTTHLYTGAVQANNITYFIGIKQGQQCQTLKLICNKINVSIHQVTSTYQTHIIVALGLAVLCIVSTFIIFVIACMVRRKSDRANNETNEEEDDKPLVDPHEQLRQLDEVTIDEFAIDDK